MWRHCGIRLGTFQPDYLGDMEAGPSGDVFCSSRGNCAFAGRESVCLTLSNPNSSIFLIWRQPNHGACPQLQPDKVVQRTAQAHHATSTGLEGLLTANSTRVHGAGAPLASAAHSSTANTNLQRRTRQTHFFTASSPQISQACASLPRRGTAMAVGEYGF